jgi:RNA polymerase sigma factor (sigma-70 family)
VNRPEPISEEIIIRASKGNKEAFSDIYHGYYKRVYFMAIQFFRNEDLANDVAQEVFIKVYKQIHTLKTPKAFSSWLYVITYRQCQNEARKKNKIEELGGKKTIEDFPDVNKEDIITNNHIKEIIKASIETMNSSLQMVATLRFFEELKLEEIADILDVSKSTVANRLSRIKKIISDDLKANGIERNASVIVTPAVMQQVYQTIFEQCTLNEPLANQILQTLLKKKMPKHTLPKKLLLSIMPISIAFIWMFNQPNNNISVSLIPPNKEIVLKEKAQIANIVYDENWHNTAFTLDITVTNEDYDRILVNGNETVTISENGTYHVTLIKDNKVIDEEDVIISNIDIYSPNATGNKVNDTYVLSLTDDFSGINENRIIYYKNGSISNNYIYNPNNQTITIPNDTNSNHTFYIDDYAGNTLEIIVKATE